MRSLTSRPEDDEQIQQLLGLDVLYLLLVSMVGLAAYLYYRNYQLELICRTEPCPVCPGVGKHKKAPLITLSEAEGFFFPSGKAVVSPEFLEKIRTSVIPQLIGGSKEFNLDLVEVVGHTDEVPVRWNSESNLDAALVSLLHGRFAVTSLSADDNVGLAMMRAVVIAEILRKDKRIQAANLIVVPLSAGQLILPNGRPTFGREGDDASRRRIDIRLRKLEESVRPSSGGHEPRRP